MGPIYPCISKSLFINQYQWILYETYLFESKIKIKTELNILIYIYGLDNNYFFPPLLPLVSLDPPFLPPHIFDSSICSTHSQPYIMPTVAPHCTALIIKVPNYDSTALSCAMQS